MPSGVVTTALSPPASRRQGRAWSARLSFRLLAPVLLALALVPAAQGGTTTAAPDTALPNPTTATTPLAQTQPRTTKHQAITLFLANDKIADWLRRYPPKPVTDATFKQGIWTVNVWSGRAGEIATGTVDDGTGAVIDKWTGPQVAWKMARGYSGAFGGAKINSYPVWLAFCAIFMLGLVDWRRLLSVRNVDILVLLSLSVSLWFFNDGDVFTAMSLAYPPLAWILLRCVWIARNDRPSRGVAVWPVWVLAAAAVFLAGFRVGLNWRASNVIDVGYSGVIGADRIMHGQSPYGHFPVEDQQPKCGPSDSEGEVRDRIQANGRCETANPLGDTYGPMSYIAYIPGYEVFGWSHKWDKLWSVHLTSILFDLLALLGLVVVGRRFGGPRLAATAAFAWAAWPFTQYASSSNTNDAIAPALLIWGFAVLTSHVGRGFFAALSGWTKFASLLVVPLWSGYPEARRPRAITLTIAGFALGTGTVFWVLLLEPSPLHAARVFYDRTVSWQIGRASPFSLWDWGQYHAKGLPDLHLVQRALQVMLVAGALALAWFPRYRSPLRMAALTGAVLVGFELVLTHWFYLYLPWFFPFVALTLLAPLPGRPPAAPMPDAEPALET